MRQKQIEGSRRKVRAAEAPTPGETTANPNLAERKKKLQEEIDRILDEIDRVLEHEDTAVNYRQLGGE